MGGTAVRCVAITNQKGGVGKTTTTANLAAGLALVGRRVIAVDLDPQSNLTLHLRADLAAPERNAYALLHGRCRFAEALVPTEIPNLRLLPATVDLAGAEVELAGVVGRESLLRDAIREFAGASGDGTRPPAEFMLFDCPPSLGVLSLNALVAAREVLIPLQAEFLSLQGVSKLLEMVDLVRRRLNPALEVTGVLACMVNPRRNLATEVLAEIRAFFGPKVFGTVVRENVRLAEAPSHGKTIFAYAADSHGAADYAALAKEFLERPAP